jgi:hypothetical protein
LVPENYNGVSDLDWCPELWIDLDCAGIFWWWWEPTIIQAPCDTCPCQYADFSSQLVKDDTVKALLRDYNKTILYKYSNPVKVY